MAVVAHGEKLSNGGDAHAFTLLKDQKGHETRSPDGGQVIHPVLNLRIKTIGKGEKFWVVSDDCHTTIFIP